MRSGICVSAVVLLLAACVAEDAGPGGGDAGQLAGTAQTPPTTAPELEQWLADGVYESWHCEADVHASRSPSPHGYNRICVNDAVADHIDETDPWPEGAAAVKELYSDAKAKQPKGYAVYLKVAEDSDQGAGWYWYERIGDSVPADGLGNAGAAKSVCVGCHLSAGDGAENTPTTGARDLVFSPGR
jgi:Cytochrome P460